MAKYSELHLQLEKCVNRFLENQTEDNSNLIIAEFTHLILTDADVLMDGIVDEENPSKYEPSGYEGPDGRFYFHIFTSKLRFDDSDATTPVVAKLKSILDQVFQHEEIGGVSINYQKGKGTVLLSKEDIYDGLQSVLKTKQ